ncbi:MAG TPA: type IV pilin protein [Rhodanobacteraceae bacterium]|nr:type IV pilin protein [Rhodanobacteraceae bacterium]
MLRSRGFTLLELMIVVAIVAILAAVAYPTYIKYITRTHRAAATACLTEYANYMERYYTTNLRYDQDTDGTAISFPDLDCKSKSQTGDSYSYAFSGTPTQAAYKILATPIDPQLSRDTECGVLGIDQSGQRYYKSTLTDPAGLNTCWKN